MTGADQALLVVAALLMGKKGASGSGSGGKKPSGSDARTSSKAADDGAKLLARANQPATERWVTLFQQQDVPAELARALARWAGIESSGDPHAVSSKGERGLLQVTKTTALTEGALSSAEWDQLGNPSTTNEEHARIAYKLANWLWQRAKKHVANAPEDYISAAWYAKLYHQRPVDVRDGKMHGPALLMARELAERWKSDAKKMHRLRAANVVAFGMPEP
jgi:hypothetical protein